MRRLAIFLALCAPALAQCLRLTSPRDGAHPHSAYIVVEGDAAPSATIEILDGRLVAARAQSDSTGRFERVVHLASGVHELDIRSGDCARAVRVEIAAFPPPKGPAPYEALQTGDVILAHDRNSPEDALYQPVYTHAALYIGPDGDGAALLLEAVTEEVATAHGPVAAVPVEESLPWRNADRVDLFRLAGGLRSADRTRIVAWARRTAARGLPFRTADLGDLYRAWMLWDPATGRPRDAAEFDALTSELRAHLQSSDAYDCSTLVWHAYRDNTEHRIDLASPNRVVWGGAMKNASPGFAAILRPLVILPDSFALSGKLKQVEP